MRLKVVAGNWKMNKTYGEALMLATEVAYDASKVHHQRLLTILAPPFPFLSAVSRSIEGTEGMAVAAQNCHQEEAGAFTGEVSVPMIISAGARFVIIGHSERRMIFNESNELLLQKTKSAINHGLKPIFCVGETKAQRDSGKHFETIKEQLDETIFHLNEFSFLEIIIAYEPVWAIGTGVNASAAQAQEMHAFIRQTISGKFNQKLGDSVSIIYGGSVSPKNAKEIFSCKDVDGGLIGGAALNTEDFSNIRKAMISCLE
ncbi:MAG: triose-phosphate isomerase [Bacteroidetes bacterium]|nr:triose-phosphate isomerase [Bacteroidota bacterium]